MNPLAPLPISHSALSAVNNVILDAQKLGASSRALASDAYGELLGSKRDLCLYIAGLEKRLGIVQGNLVKF